MDKQKVKDSVSQWSNQEVWEWLKKVVNDVDNNMNDVFKDVVWEVVNERKVWKKNNR